MNIKIIEQNLQRRLLELSKFNMTPGEGITRPVYSQEFTLARKYIISEMHKIGLTVKEDPVGNVFGELPGSDPTLAPVWTGSHIDTVKHGGMFDGMAGVCAGLEAASYIKDSHKPHRRTLSVNVYAGEEMSRFGVCCIGSRSLAGLLSTEDLKKHVDSNGKSLYQTLQDAGYNIASFAKYFPQKQKVQAAIELHIEQSSYLDAVKVPVGIVTGICAPTNLILEVQGVQSHAGGTSMQQRRDAFMACAEIALALEKLARESHSTYITGTVGEVGVQPNVASVIPGNVRFSVDIRSISLQDKDALLKKFEHLLEQIGTKRAVKIHKQLLNHDQPLLCDPEIMKIIGQKASALAIPYKEVVSGPYHDSLFLGAFTRVAMLFVPSKDGISHDRAEYTAYQDIAKGTAVLTKSLYALLND